MKYILELDESSCTHERGMDFYRCKQVPWWNVSDRIISKLPPYTEPDRKAIEDEVWKLADTIHGMSIQEKMACFGFSLTSAVTLNLSYQEAKAKYEAWKKKGVIHVGDEIMSVEDDVKAVMLDCADYESIYVMTEHGCVERWKDLDGVKKTGRTFPEVTELLEKMRGGE